MATVAVIGAGVLGLTTAVALQRRMPWVSVTLITERLSPETTGDGSAGFWEPYLLGDTPSDNVLRWSKRSYDIFCELWKSPLAGDAGVSLVPVIYVSEDSNQSLPDWRQVVLGFKEMNKTEISQFSSQFGKQYRFGFRYISFTCEPTKYLPLLLQEFKTRGGILQLSRVSSLNELASSRYSVVVNCTGLQARFVVPDLDMHPIRGQVLRVKAPDVFHCFMDDSNNGCYIIPNHETVILGGTKQNDWNLKVDPKDSQFIHSSCCSVLPQLRGAQIVKEWVGLRPGRFQVRLERESRKLPNGQEIEIVHNYGHGGAGVTLSWGCAEEAVDIVHKILEEKTPRSML
ncbi:D-aspartate oxidase [Gryllus bimaculatus]|nr:D-aspartate oxidase [Gryllus bimaculatus]